MLSFGTKLRALDSRGELGRAVILRLYLRKSESQETHQSSGRQFSIGSEPNLEPSHLLTFHHTQRESPHPPWI